VAKANGKCSKPNINASYQKQIAKTKKETTTIGKEKKIELFILSPLCAGFTKKIGKQKK